LAKEQSETGNPVFLEINKITHMHPEPLNYAEESRLALTRAPTLEVPSVTLVEKPAKKSDIPFSNLYNMKAMKYIVTSGNNSKLIKEAMKRRSWWIEMPPIPCKVHFKW